MKIKTSLAEFIHDDAICPGTSTEILTNQRCVVPLSALIVDPYNIAYGTGIYVKVSAVNAFGESTPSVSGNGAIMVVVPDTPVNLAKDIQNSNKDQITITWEAAAFNGGKPVLDFRLWWDNATGSSFVQLATMTGLTFTTTVTPGLTYQFYIEARNQVGYSLPSDPISVLAA